MNVATEESDAYKMGITQRKSFDNRPVRNLTRLKSLQAFEATSRHGSFAGAATELHVSAAAVGQLVRSLETWLGAPLFHRRSGNERLILTEEARSSLVDITEGLDRLDSGLRRLTARRARGVVTVTASQAIVATWLLPHLDGFAALHSNIDLRLDVTDRLADIASNEADIGIRCGPGTWEGISATHLMDEEIIAVCAPFLLPADLSTIHSHWLSTQTLIHDTMPRTVDVFPDWSKWLARAGISLENGARGPRVNSSAAVIQAAINGQGLVLARHNLVRHHLQANRLCRLFEDISWPIEWGYYAVASPRTLRRPEVAKFHDWLVTNWHAPPATAVRPPDAPSPPPPPPSRGRRGASVNPRPAAL